MIVVPTRDYPHYTEEVVLDGRAYLLSFSWNTRGEFWSLGIGKTDGTSIVSGIRLVLGMELIGAYNRADMPPGEMFVVDVSGNRYEVGRYSFPDEMRLVYVPEDEG